MTQEIYKEDLLSFYDAGFIAYLINESPDDVIRRMNGTLSSFESIKEDVLSQLVILGGFLLEQSLPDIQRNVDRMSRLSHYSDDLNDTSMAYFRKLCGGIQALPKTNNEVERLLLEYA